MSGVDQMKIPGNPVKSVEERNIPWSQQVDEASYENLASPANDDNSVNQSSMQFQYPPFHVKESQNSTWNNANKGRKSSNNFDSNKKYGKPGVYNNSKRDDHQLNAWSSRRFINENSGNPIRHNRHDEGISSGKLDNRSNESVEENKMNTAAMAPKKTTWASIASQPAKLTSRTTLTISSHKKKGPGMPPPPMVPGKHNLDVNTWDLPNNNPPLVPSPPPPIDLSCADINSDFSVTNSTEPPLGARSDKVHKNIDYGQQQPQHSHPHQQQQQQQQRDDNKGLGNSTNYNRAKTSPNGHTRKGWATTPHHQSMQQTSGRPIVTSSGPSVVTGNRRMDGGMPPLNRYNDRRPNYSGPPRSDCENSGKYDYRDENNPRVTESSPPTTVEEITVDPQSLLEELKDKNNYNPTDIDLDKASTARFFVIKSYSEDDIHRSIKYEIWCSTDHGNKRLDDAFKERHKDNGNILLFFSVNGSGHFCGMAQMMTAVDYNSTSSVWSQDKWKGKFKVKWIYVKDVPNGKLRHIRLENNDNKSVTNSRDTQEVPNAKGIEVLQILHSYKHSTSIFDDFSHYEKKQEEEVSSKRPPIYTSSDSQAPTSRHYMRRENDDRERDRDARDNRGQNSGMAQKYFLGNATGSGGGGFRERNSIHRSGGGGNGGSSGGGGGGGGFHNNYSEYRRGFGNDYQQKDRENTDYDRENEFSTRQGPNKFDNNRRDDHSQHAKPRQNNRERDFSSDQIKNDIRFRPGLSRDLPKENEKERIRSNEY